MPECVIVRGDDGKLAGLGQQNARRYEAWRRLVEGLEVGETLTFAYRKPRSGPFHRRHFAMLARIFDQQERFTEPEPMRLWLQVGAGYADLVPGRDGLLVAVPMSIAYDSMDDVEFAEHHAAVCRFLREDYCIRYLWPMANPVDAGAWMDAILAEFDA